MTDIVVSSGQTSSGITLNSGDTLSVLSGGFADDITVHNGGVETVFSSGTASGTVVSSGGSLFVEAGGTASRTMLVSGGFDVVFGSATGTVASGTGEEFVEAGGVATSARLGNAGFQEIDFGGVARGALVGNGGEQIVFPGGVASGTLVSSGGTLDLAGGTVVSGTVSAGGTLLVESGGVVEALSGTNSLNVLSSGTSVGSLVNSGTLVIGIGGTEALGPGVNFGGTIFAGQTIAALSGARLSGATVLSGGLDVVSSGGIASGTIVSNGGTEIVSSGGAASGTVVSSGGTLDLLGGGTLAGGTLSPGAVLEVDSGATVEVISGTTLDVLSGGVIVGSVSNGGGTLDILSGGTLTVVSGGTARGVIINDGGAEIVSAGAIDSGALLGGGNQSVAGRALDVVLDGNAVQTVSSGGVAVSTIVSATDSQVVLSGGSALGTIVDSGGALDIFGGATASGATIASSGTLVLDNDAFVSSTDGGATLHVLSGGTSVGTIANSGATIDVTGSNAELDFVGSNTFNNSTINLGNAGGAFISSIDAGGGAVLTLGSSATVNHTTGSGELTGDSAHSGDGIVNDGTIDATAGGGTLRIDPLNFTNFGTITGRNGDTVFIQPAGSFTNFNSTTGDLSGGTYDIGSGSVIELSPNQFVTQLDATLILGGNGASLQNNDGSGEIGIDQVLTTIGPSGALYVEGDANPIFQNNLTDAGVLQLGGIETQVSGIAIVGTRSVTLDGQNVTVNGTISDESGQGIGTGVGTVVVNGSGSALLLGSNTYTGGTIVSDSGTILTIGDDSNLGASGSTLSVISGAALELGQLVNSSYTISHNVKVGGDALFEVDGGVTATLTGQIGDAGGPGTLNVAASVFNGAGTLVLDNAGNRYTGGTVISAGTLEIAVSGAAGTGGITFAPQLDPTLRIDAAALPANATFANTISGFAPGDDIDLAGVPFAASETLSINASSVLTVREGGNFYSLPLDPSQNFVSDVFYLANDGSGNTNIIAASGLSAGAGQAIDAPIVFNGAVVLDSGTVTNARIESGGLVVVSAGGTTSDTVINGGTLEVQAGGVVGGGVTFAATGGTYQIDGTTIPGATVSGFVSGDFVDLRGIQFDSSGSVDLVNSGSVHNQLQIHANGSSYDLQLDPAQVFASSDYFHLSNDESVSSGTLVTENTTPCYCRGTRILTPDGEAPVEDLKIGDRVVTLFGQVRPIHWIGRRSYSGQFVLGRDDILPVCIRAGAIEGGIPRRDLWVSPNHALYLGGVLIEAKDLVNGASVYQAGAVERVEYFHLELDQHDVILAEGAWAESYIDDDNRGLFHNAAEYWAAHPERVTAPAQYCAPRQEEGFEVERARAGIAERAGLTTSGEVIEPGTLRGHVDGIGRRGICGWALDEACPEAPVCLDIYAGKELIGQAVANRYRADLEAAGIGDGRHGFEFVPPAGLAFAPGSVTVRRSRDGAALNPCAALAEQLAGGAPRRLRARMAR